MKENEIHLLEKLMDLKIMKMIAERDQRYYYLNDLSDRINKTREELMELTSE